VVSVTDPHGRVLGFPDRSCYFFSQVALQLYSQGLVDPITDLLLSDNLVAPGLEPGPPDQEPAEWRSFSDFQTGAVAFSSK
jgi:hypothetical protein